MGIFKALVDLDKKAEDGYRIRTIMRFMLERHGNGYLKNLMEAVPVGAPVRLTCFSARVIRRNNLNLVFPPYVRQPEDSEWGAK